MKDIIKACLALVMVVVLAIGVFYDGNSKSKQLNSTSAETQNYESPARIDVHAPIAPKQQFQVLFNNQEKKQEPWAKTDERYTVESKTNPLKFTIKPLQDIPLTLEMRGHWEKGEDGKLIEHWISYSSVKLDDKELLPSSQAVWHDKPYTTTVDLKAGKTYQIEAVWEPK